MYELERLLVAYDSTDALVGEYELTEAQVDTLRPMLDFGDDHELYETYLLQGTPLDLVESWLGVRLDRSMFYYLETTADY